ncbi:P-loop containing nucleoside triphosphate hydrolase protein [Pelagophyceae sp. CCMP2097]|nr:P-loop containing nucleoside triphosphate hydrolase protein [Pelagophyceae sp. CCMP2097]
MRATSVLRSLALLSWAAALVAPPRRLALCRPLTALANGAPAEGKKTRKGVSAGDGGGKRKKKLKEVRLAVTVFLLRCATAKRNADAKFRNAVNGGPAWFRKVVLILAKFRAFAPLFLGTLFLTTAVMRRAAARPVVPELPYSVFMNLVASKRVSNVMVSPQRLSFLFDGRAGFTRPVRAAPELVALLLESGVLFGAPATGGIASALPLLLPILWLLGINQVMKKQMNGATGSVAQRAKRQAEADATTFEDVAGVDIAKQEVQEIVSMLKNPGKYAAAGARLPAGVLMVGPPGTGKTLMARAMAAQAKVPFFFCMRSLFKEAEQAAPCIIFVDELDALGKQRSMRLGGSNDEVEQTLNQMLACMDGLESSNNNVVVMGATNRYEILDPALTRPGRFDRLVRIGLPDEAGRLAILRVHTRKLKFDGDMNLKAVAAATPGFSGAELAALANEAAIRAVRRDSTALTLEDFKGALETSVKARRGFDSILSSFMPK